MGGCGQAKKFLHGKVVYRRQEKVQLTPSYIMNQPHVMRPCELAVFASCLLHYALNVESRLR